MVTVNVYVRTLTQLFGETIDVSEDTAIKQVLDIAGFSGDERNFTIIINGCLVQIDELAKTLSEFGITSGTCYLTCITNEGGLL